MRKTGLIIAALCAAAPAFGQTVDGDTARGELFNLRGRSLQIVDLPGIGELERKVLDAAAGQVVYYGAVAMAPDQGLLAEATVVAGDYHSAADASAAAIRACNGRRSGGAECVVAALVLPARYETRNITLSHNGTEGFRKEYRNARAPKAMAISPGTGKWAVSTGDGAADNALASCNQQAMVVGGQADCRVAIAD